MNLKPRLLPILYGVATYVAMLFIVSPLLGRAVYYVFPKRHTAADSLGAIAAGLLTTLFVGVVVSPILCGFVTARTANDQPYLHFSYVLLLIGGPMTVVLHRLERSPGHQPPFRIYAIFSLLLACAATYSGAQRAAAKATEDLLKSLRD